MELADRLTEALGDRYRIEKEIGSGGMATVFLAHDLKHDRAVALKVLRDQVAQSVGAERFLQEIRIVAQLQHPHVLTLLDSGEVEGTLYYVMPYIEGESLREKLEREQELPVPDALRLLREVADALAFAHGKGVVHRDIKPDNVLLTGRHAVVADFGVSKALSAATGENKVTTLGVALGTPAYMAPEQAAADQHIDHRADIYALGILGYELLTGRPPFTGSTPQQILGAQVTETPRAVTEIRPAVPEAVSGVLMRCLEKRPADRWQTAEELRAQFEALQTSSGGITPTGMTPVAKRGRPKWVMPVAAVAVVVAVGIGVWMVVGGGGGPPGSEGEGSGIGAGAAAPDEAGAGVAAEDDRADRVVVLPLENLTGDPSLDPLTRQGSSAIERALSQTDAAEVVPLQSFGGEAAEVPVPQVAEELRAGLVVTGEYYRRGEELEFAAHLLDPAGGRTLYDLWTVRGSPDDPTAAFETLGDRVAAAIEFFRVAGGVAGMEYLTPPPSMEALRLFGEMVEFQSRLEYQEALERGRRIAQRDTTWLTHKTWEQAILNASDRLAEADSVWAFLDARRDRLTQAEGLRSDHLHASLVGDAEEVYRKSKMLEDFGWYNPYNSAISCSNTNRLEEALVHLDRLTEYIADRRGESEASLPEVFIYAYSGRVTALARLGRLEEALDVARRAKSVFPDQTAPLLWEAQLLAAMGRRDEVVAVFEESRGHPASAGSWSPAEPLRQATLVAAGTGRAEDASRYAELVLEEVAGDPGDTRSLRARTLAYARRWDEAEPLFREFLEEDPENVSNLGMLGWILGSQGKTGEAAAVRERIGSLGLEYRYRGPSYYWQAAISTSLGEHDRAIRELQDALATGQGFGVWTIWFPWFLPLHDDPRYQRWVAPK